MPSNSFAMRKLVAECGGEVVVECPRTLVELFRSARGVGEVVAAGEPLPPFDCHVPMLSQPLISRRQRRKIPAEVPYLFADPSRCEAWRERLGGRRSRLKVGSRVGGKCAEPTDSKASHLYFKSCCPYWSVEGIDFFSLQMGSGAEQIRAVVRGVAAHHRSHRAHHGLRRHSGAHDAIRPDYLRGYRRGASGRRAGAASLDAAAICARLALGLGTARTRHGIRRCGFSGNLRPAIGIW